MYDKSRFNRTALSKAVLASALMFGVNGAAFATGVPVKVTEAQTSEYAPETTVVAKYEAQSHTYITPRVSGFITAQTHADGEYVKKGETLFTLDDTEYQYNYELAKSQVKQANARKTQARLHHERVQQLQGPGGSTQSDLENAQAELDAANALFDVATISAKKAKYDLDSTVITAPYDGKLGKSNVSVGDYVSPASGPLIDIVLQSPMNVTFNVGLDTFETFNLDEASQTTVELNEVNQPAAVNFISNAVNPTAGTVEVSAEFDNQTIGVKPNSVTHVTLKKRDTTSGYWLPETALIQDLTLQYVYIIDEQDTAQRRDVTVLTRDKGKAFVSSGIQEHDKVITDGLIRVRPNARVTVSAGE